MSDTSIPRANTRIGTAYQQHTGPRINNTKQSLQIRSFLLKTEPIWYNISFVLALFPSTRKELIMGKNLKGKECGREPAAQCLSKRSRRLAADI